MNTQSKISSIHFYSNRSNKNKINYIFCIPDSDQLTNGERKFINLGDENAGYSLVKSCAIHVDCRTDGQNETRHASINSQVSFQASEQINTLINIESLSSGKLY